MALDNDNIQEKLTIKSVNYCHWPKNVAYVLVAIVSCVRASENLGWPP